MNENKKLKIINNVMEKLLTQKQAAYLLNISDRQVRNIILKIKNYGPEGIKHLNRYNKPMHTFSEAFKESLITMKKSDECKELTFSQFLNYLKQRDIRISYASIHNILTANGIKSPNRHKKVKPVKLIHPKEHMGELVQTKIIRSDWFIEGEFLTLHGLMDDATGEVIGLYLCEKECLLGYLEITRQMLERYGVPEAICSNHSSVFFPVLSSGRKCQEKAQSYHKNEAVSQLHTILDELGIEIMVISSCQERICQTKKWETIQKELKKDFKATNIKTIEQANLYFPKYISRYNRKQGKKPISSESYFVRLPANKDIDLLLSVKMTQPVTHKGVFYINNSQFMLLQKNEITPKDIKVYISPRIGVLAEHNGCKFNLVTLHQSIDDHRIRRYTIEKINSTRDLKEFARGYCSSN